MRRESASFLRFQRVAKAPVSCPNPHVKSLSHFPACCSVMWRFFCCTPFVRFPPVWQEFECSINPHKGITTLMRIRCVPAWQGSRMTKNKTINLCRGTQCNDVTSTLINQIKTAGFKHKISIGDRPVRQTQENVGCKLPRKWHGRIHKQTDCEPHYTTTTNPSFLDFKNAKPSLPWEEYGAIDCNSE